MYFLVIRQLGRSLRNLDAVIGKAQAYAQSRKFEVNNFMTARLAPDMLAFPAQVRIACDTAKAAAANLSGKPAPKHEDNETTIEELRGRIARCLSVLDGYGAADFQAIKADDVIKVPMGPSAKLMRAEDYLLARQIPNFYFHMSMAYALLRHGGVDIGKADFLALGDLLREP